MKLTCAKYGLEINFRENIAEVLILENPVCMTEVITCIKAQCEGNEGILILSEKDNYLKFEKSVLAIVNPFSLNLNDRKILSKLYNQMEAYGSDFGLEKEKINAQIISMMDQLILKSPYENLTYQLEPGWIELFKAYDLCFEKEKESLLENLIEYIKVISNLTGIQLVCLINIKSYFTNEEILEFYKYVFYNKLHVLLIETVEREKLSNEDVFIVDKDLCLIRKYASI